MVRRLTNAFVGLLLLDGALGLVDGVIALTTGEYALEGLRGFVGFFFSCSVLALFTALHITPRLRLGVFLPPLLLVTWIQLGAMPLPLWLGLAGTKAACGVLALFAGAALVHHARGRTGKWLFDDSCFEGQAVSSRRITGFAALVLLVLLPGTLLYAYLSVGALLNAFTGGYLRFDTTGLYAKDQTYARDAERIRLIATMHVAVPTFYRGVLDSIPEGSLTLAEGVTDREKLLTGFDYGGAADVLGLSSQSDEWASWSRTHDVRTADIDVSDLSKPTIRLLQGMSRVMIKLGERDTVGALLAYAALSELDVEADQVLEDVLQTRNAHLLSAISAALEESDRLIVPWGAAHMKGVSEGVVDMGFEPIESREWRVLTW